MSELRLSLLGPPRIECDGAPLALHRHKDIALLAYLALGGMNPGRERHTREALVTLLWPELEPSRARAGLRRNLSALRKTLGEEWLLVDRESVGLNPEAKLWVDVARFRDLLRASPDDLEALEEAVALYRGDFLEGFSLPDSAQFDDWQFFQGEGLRQELADALERLVRGHRSTEDGRSAGAAHDRTIAHAIPYARRWVTLDPLHEPAQQALMLVYARAGQRAAALRQYEECVRVLEEELGLSPAPETTALYERIRAGRIGPERVQEVDAEAEREPPSAPSPTLPNNLPAQGTPFVGRAEERAEVMARLRDPGCRLLTIVGPGGMGKTRLAIQAAEDLVSEGIQGPFEHGVWFVPLAPVRSPEGIVPAIAQALGLSLEGGDPRRQVLDYLCRRSLLLVLDNVEHLVEGTVDLVGEIIERAPQVVVLATSRANLNARDENLLPLGGMDTPQSLPPASVVKPEEALRYSAVQLFLQGARRVRPDFELRAEDVAPVGRICRLVHGMPLGLLLAAAWVEMLSPAEIAAEIERSFDFLAVDWRDAPARQRSVRAVYDHSWNLLSEREQEVCRALSVFWGTFSRTAAQAVTGALLRELTSLVRKSLIHRTPDGRFEAHELLRQYAEEKLEVSPSVAGAVRERYAAYYASALQRWRREMTGPRQKAVLAEMDVEIDNLRAAWHWMVERRQAAHLNRAADGVGHYAGWRKREYEFVAWYRVATRALSAPEARSPLDVGDRLRALVKILAWQAWLEDDAQVTRELMEKSLALLDGPELADVDVRSERAFVLATAVRTSSYLAYEQSRQASQQSLALYEALGDRVGMALVLEDQGRAASRYGLYEEASLCWERCLKMRRELGDRLGQATMLVFLAMSTLRLGQFERAEGYARESLAIRQELQGAPGVGLQAVGWAVAHRGRYDEARALLEESAVAFDAQGSRHWIARANALLGFVEAHLGRYAQARAQGQMCLAILPEASNPKGIISPMIGLGMAALGSGKPEEAWQLLKESAVVHDASMPKDWQILALPLLGYAALRLGQLLEAEQRFHQILQMASEHRDLVALLYVLSGVAALLADESERSTPDVERAVEVYALASRYPFVANSRWFEDVAGRDVVAAAETLPPEVVAAAQERGRAADPWGVTEELLGEWED